MCLPNFLTNAAQPTRAPKPPQGPNKKAPRRRGHNSHRSYWCSDTSLKTADWDEIGRQLVQQGIHLCTSHRLLHHLSATDQGHLYDSHGENDAAADDVIDAASAKRTPVSAFKNPKRLSWCVHFSGVNTSGTSISCQHFSGAKAFMASALFWCQRFTVSALFCCQHRPPGPFDRRLWAESSGFDEAEVKRVASREAKRRPERRSRSGQGRGGKATWWMLTIACNQRCISNVGKDVGCDKIQTEGTPSWNWFRRPFQPDRQAHPIARTEISRRHILADSTIDETVQ